ncbi:MAG: hypothetical protein Q4P13_12485, partial [Psychrobacter sp.]|nr:hypothetical protein [Psychrobacter sp.]
MTLPLLPKPLIKRSMMFAVSIMVVLMHLSMMWALTYFDILTDSDKPKSETMPAPIEIQLVTLNQDSQSKSEERQSTSPKLSAQQTVNSTESQVMDELNTSMAKASKAIQPDTINVAPSLPSNEPSQVPKMPSNSDGPLSQPISMKDIEPQDRETPSEPVDEAGEAATESSEPLPSTATNHTVNDGTALTAAQTTTGQSDVKTRLDAQPLTPLPFEREIMESQAFQAT